jgi:aerobic carbon-monoxide dehydrogenase medium subunit
MRSVSFEYARPATVDEAVTLLAEHGDDAKILAGGQSLVPLLNFRMAQPSHVVDIGALTSLAYIRPTATGLEIGALTSQRAVELSADVERQFPLLHEAIAHVGHRQTRNRGTIGGSLVHADPAAELPAVALASRAELRVRGPDGERLVAAAEFFKGYLATAMSPNELLLSVRFPSWPQGTGSCFLEFCRRQGDFAIVGAAALVSLAADGTVANVGLALNGVGGRPFDGTPVVGAALLGKVPENAVIAQAAASIEAAVEPDSDVHAPADYRRHLAKLMTARALAGAAGRARTVGGGH